MLTFCNGMGTSEDEKGVAPAENETLGLLFVLLRTIVVFELDAPNDVINEPEKKRLASDALVVIDVTGPLRPPNGGADQEEDLTSQTATPRAGLVNEPPTQTLLSFSSQKIADTCPLGASLELKAVKLRPEGE